MPAGEELALLILHTVDAVHHGLIGGEYAVGREVLLLLAEVCAGKVGQQVHKASLGLGHQRIPVSQEQNVLHPAVLQQYIAQGDDRSGFAGAGGHDQQSFPAVLVAKGIANSLDGTLLIVPARNVLLYHHIFERHPHGAQVEHLLQIPLGVDSRALALRVLTVENVGLKAVGQEDRRAAAVLLFQNVRIEFCLLTTLGHIHTGALGFDHRQRPVGIVIEHIVRKAHFAPVGHSGQLHLIDPVLAFHPAGIFQHGVDVELPGFVLGDIQRLGHIGLLLLGPAGSQLLFQLPVFLHQRSQTWLHLCGCRACLCLWERCRRSRRRGYPCRVKLRFLIGFRIAVGHEVQKNVQIFQAEHGHCFRDLSGIMGSGVALLADKVHPLPKVVTNDCTEFLPGHQALEIVLIGHFQLLVHGVHPLHGKLHGPPAVENTGSGINM